MENDILGRHSHKQRKSFATALWNSSRGTVLKEIDKGFMEIGLGREVVAYAQKMVKVTQEEGGALLPFDFALQSKGAQGPFHYACQKL